MAALDDIRAFHNELTDIRRDIHAHPEIGFEEHRTAEIVAQKLTEWGVEVHRGIGGTGVVGVLRRGNGQASIGLRADMDALPIEEANDVPYRSTAPGRMHACGHDGHTTMLLAAARYLAKSGNFNGTVNFIFQPAEEGLGGAQAMLKAGLCSSFRATSCTGCITAPAAGRQIRHPSRHHDGGRRFLRHHRDRTRFARRAAGRRHRSGAGRLPHHHGIAVDRFP